MDIDIDIATHRSGRYHPAKSHRKTTIRRNVENIPEGTLRLNGQSRMKFLLSRRALLRKFSFHHPHQTRIQTTCSDRCQLKITRSPPEDLSNTSHREQPKRPLRRAEFGHDAKDIEKYEQMGFVMSGNRRKRKDPPLMDEESKKAGYKLQKQEKASRESEIVAKFKAMIQGRQAEIGSGSKV
jgi:hypothetical protein